MPRRLIRRVQAWTSEAAEKKVEFISHPRCGGALTPSAIAEQFAAA